MVDAEDDPCYPLLDTHLEAITFVSMHVLGSLFQHSWPLLSEGWCGGPWAFPKLSKLMKNVLFSSFFHEEYRKLNEAVMEFVEQQRAEKRPLLVHCFAGMNRSAALCAGVSHDEGQSRTQQWEFRMVGGMCWSCLMNRVKSSWLRGWWFSVVFWWFGWPLSTGRNEWASSEWWNFWVKSVDGSSATSLNRWSLSILVGAGKSKPKYGKPNIKSLSDRGTAIVPPFATCLQEKIKNTWRSIQ